MSPATPTKCAKRARRRPRKAPIWSSFPNCSSPAIRPRIWCSNRRSRRPAARRSRRWRRKLRQARPCYVGTPWLEGGKLYNAVALLAEGAISALRFKVDLPNYGVFDEKRVFAPGPMPGPVSFRGVRLGMPICEDIWGTEVVECLAETGAEILLVPNGSPYWRQQGRHPAQHRGGARHRDRVCRWSMSTRLAARTNSSSTAPPSVCNADCSLAFQLAAFEEAVVTTHWQRRGATLALRGGSGGRGGRSRPCRLYGLRAGPARLRQQERISRRGARPFRRHRLCAVCGDGGRCARRRPRALRDAAVQIHRAGIARRCGSLRQGARACATRCCRSPKPSRAWKRRWRRSSPVCRATSPKRTCRRARAAPS